VLALVTLKAVLELSPLNSTTVPPDKTGLVPREARPALVPLEIVETVDPLDDESGVLSELQTLHAVISRFQMPDPDAVSLKTKVYPFEVPLKLPRAVSAFEEIPLNTDVNVVFRIELLVVDSDDTPKVVCVPPVSAEAANCP
jgi:hypothetical protein